MGWLLNKIMSWVTGLIVDSFSGVFKVLKNVLMSTPDVTTLPQVQEITARAVTVLDVVFVLAFVAAGALTMFAGGDERSRYTAKTLMPRMIVAFIVAHFSPLFCSQITSVAGAMTTALAGGDPNHAGAMTAIGSTFNDANNGKTAALLFAVLAAITCFLLVAVAFSFITRLGVLVIIASVGPLALACHALPQLEGVAKLWWRSLIGCLLIPLLQVIALQVGESILLNPKSQGTLLGLPGSGVLNMMIVISLMFICVKIPSLVRKSVMQQQGSGLGAQIFRVLVIQQGLRLVIGGASAGARLVRAGAGAAATRR
jgi:Conjugal transfer protein TrbL